MRPAGCGCTGKPTGKVFLVDGIHDLGGMQGFAEVSYSPAEPVFRHRWEAAARALLVVVAGAVEASGGEFRHSIERMERGHYLTSSYYEHWLTAAATLAVEHGLVPHSELEARAGGRFPLSGPVLTPPVADAGPDMDAPRFAVGDRVRVREWHSPGHPYRARMVREPRKLLAEMGCSCPMTPRSGCGIPPPRFAISCCPSDRRGPRT
jgi:nitrile hydratase subunit beta